MTPPRLLAFFVGLVVLFAVASNLAGLGVDYLWFQELGQESVFRTSLITRIGLGVVGFFVALAFALGNVFYAHRRSPFRPYAAIGEVRIELPSARLTVIALTLACVALAAALGAFASTAWMQWLEFRARVPFGIQDPLFRRDVSFHVFTLPILEILRSWWIALVALTLLLCGLVYGVKGGLFLEGRLLLRPARHLVALFAVGGIALAFHYWLAGFGLLQSARGVAHGASYADVNAQLPAYRILMVASLVASAVVVIGSFRKNLRLMASGPLLLVLATVIGSWAYPSILQKLVVEPNELEKETPYLRHNIEFTRKAYGLDETSVRPFEAGIPLDAAALARNEPTLRNIRLWDWRPLRATYSQLQEIRLYYNFVDVDVDRYRLDGVLRQVMLSPRELSSDQLPAEARTWVNLHLKYTHGYGLCLSPVDRVTPEGLPELLIRDIPPVTTADLPIDQPRLYFGEETLPYALVQTRTDEFDYPIGESNASFRYDGAAGVSVGSWGRRALFALALRDRKLLFTNYIQPETKILIRRRLEERVPRLAPFLLYDSDPYLVIVGGRLVWIQDAYTTTSRYPYSEPFGSINYIRNSVKVSVDAYDGTTRLYAIDDQDPMLQAYRKVFPSLFLPRSDAPPEIQERWRYPEDFFRVRAALLTKYHMTDPEMFYNREDLWALATETYGGREETVEPYYVVMLLPGETEPEMVLMVPFTPSNKDNMVAWLAARCDGPALGESVIFSFPKQSLVYGPRQIEARIDQDAEISQELTLWSQRGSEVIRGNLLVIPVEGTLLYAEPLYLQAQNGELPELKRVILSDGERIVMESTLPAALASMYGSDNYGPDAYDGEALGDEGAGRSGEGFPSSRAGADTISLSVIQRMEQVRSVYEDGEAAMRRGDWAAYGRAQQELGRLLSRANDR